MDVRLPDGTIIRGVPEGITKADLVTKLKANGYDTSGLEGASSAPQMPAMMQRGAKEISPPDNAPSKIESFAGGAGAGFGRTVLGAQLLAGKGLQKAGEMLDPPKTLRDLIVPPSTQNPLTVAGNWLANDAAQGREKLSQEVAPYKAANPLTTGAGQFTGEMVATAPVGGVLGSGAKAMGASPALVNALTTGGMRAGTNVAPGFLPAAADLATRMAGGAITGGAAGALVSGDAEGAKSGAIIGGALPVIGKAAQLAGALGKKAIGGTTGVGEEALNQAFQAGKAGGQAAEQFKGGLRGASNMEDVLTMAKQNLESMGQQKQAAYRQGMAGIKEDKTVLSLKNVDQAVNDALGMATFKGQVKNEKAAQALSQIKGEIDNWKSLDPAEFHTPEGLDALKQKIGGILEEIPFEQKTARSAAGKVYDSLKSEISQQAPEYSKVMKGYSEASDTIKEIERALSLGQKASADTAMRKLQSLMRNNVNTNYGQRTKLAEALQRSGGQEFMPALAGHALNSPLPRGIQQALSGTGGAGLALTGNILPAAGLAAVSSPRLMGETFYGAGKMAGAINPAIIEALRRGTYKAAPIAAQK